MNRNQVQENRASWFNPGGLATTGRGNLESVRLSTNFESWLRLVEEKTGKYAKLTTYTRHWLNGRSPEEAINLVAVESAKEKMAHQMHYLA